MSVHQNLKRIREQKKLSQQYLANRLHITQTAYSLIESGKTKIDVDRIRQLAGILDTPFADLMTDDEANSKVVSHPQTNNADNNALIEVLKNELAIKNEQINMLHKLLERKL